MSANLDTLLPLLVPHVRNCPKPQMILQLRETARTLAAKTKLIRDTLMIDIVGGQPIYTLTELLKPDLEVCGVKAAQFCGTPLIPRSMEEVSQYTGEPFCFGFLPPDQIWIGGVPSRDRTNGLAVSVWLQPTESASEIPDEMIREYRPVIIDGAIAALLSQPAGWGDMKKALLFQDKFDRGLDMCRYNQDRANRPFAFRTIPGW